MLQSKSLAPRTPLGLSLVCAEPDYLYKFGIGHSVRPVYATIQFHLPAKSHYGTKCKLVEYRLRYLYSYGCRLRRSMQHLLKGYLRESGILRSFSVVDSSAAQAGRAALANTEIGRYLGERPEDKSQPEVHLGYKEEPRQIILFQINEKKWWRRGESEHSGVLKTLKLLIFRHARYALASGIAPNWNVSGTRLFCWPIRILIL
jgi:hypothetical protein